MTENYMISNSYTPMLRYVAFYTHTRR